MSGKNANSREQSLPVESQFLLYQTEDGQTRIEVRLQDETVWMTQAAIAELYQTTPQNIPTHLKAIYTEGELEASATCKEYLQVQHEGSRRVSRTRKFYNLRVIIAVGYRVRSHQGTLSRIDWAPSGSPRSCRAGGSESALGDCGIPHPYLSKHIT